MVSSLWKACAEGDLDKVVEFLNDGQSVDIEVKDHTGVTPLICAVQSGKLDLVKLLLDRGADPTNASSHGPPESYTSDPAMLGLLAASKNQNASNGIPFDAGYLNDPNAEQAKAYFPPPPGPYYYPGVPVPPPMHPDGSVAYYPPPPPPPHLIDGGLGHLPPPDIARMIPCRYYPACRYGSSCLFAHPQGPYLQGPLPPPAQYPAPYDSMNSAPYPPYYSMPPPSFPPPPNGIPISPPPTSHPPPPVGGPLPMAHTRSGSELLSPAQAPFSPNGAPPAHYPVVSPVSTSYPHPGPVPVPLSIPPLPPLQHPLSAHPQSPQPNYPPTSPSVPAPPPGPYMMHREPVNQQTYNPVGMPHSAGAEATSPRSPIHHPNGEAYGPGPVHRESMPHSRRGGPRRPSFGGMGRKPPCLFFPSGRCRNGDDCRFPHVLSDGQAPHNAPFMNGRGGHRHRPAPHVNGFGAVEEKLASLTIQDEQTNGVNGNATDGSSRSQSTEPGSRGRSHGFKSNPHASGTRPSDKRPTAPRPQRVPSADEFPVLAGSSTPPLRSPGLNSGLLNGHNGPTAAQVLQAPPPRKEKDSQPGTRGGSPDSSRHSVKVTQPNLYC
ncbi:hypothetical protein BXZ70DRAFT_905894 [Cristinia sonorae]|uniref:C3H1-type domain-containing protein n=1 Tax=Cristinia sonorae TaxID=1940300 RepID=A0A8K0XRJ3_9AGAR|nr:hypothetical protein BXZ70DRAFT_905894 [Cristinia sonorae]